MKDCIKVFTRNIMQTNEFYIIIVGEKIRIEYSKSPNYHVVGLNDRPFIAIKNGTKKIEVRTNTSHSPFDYFSIKPSDEIEFINEITGESLIVKVVDIRKYNSVRELLEAEGTRNVLSSCGNLEQGIISINRLTGYFESIPKFGVLAIEINHETQKRSF